MRALIVYATILSSIACASKDGAHLAALPSPCKTAILKGQTIQLHDSPFSGAALAVMELPTSTESSKLAIVADSGLFLGTFRGDSISVTRLIARRGEAVGQFLSLDAVSEGQNGEIVAFDRQLHRITRWGQDGIVKQSFVLPLASRADRYLAGGGAIVVVTSRSGNEPYAPTVGELQSLDSLGYPDSVLATFPSLVLHLVNGPEGSKFLARPLEIQPMVRWSTRYGWVIASTDSLYIRLGSARNPRIISGAGDRAPIDSYAKDSSIDAFVRSTGAKEDGRAEARSFATTTFFHDRTDLQLIDDIVPLLDGRIAVRRMRLCGDREGWNLLDSLGHPTGTIAVPHSFRAIMPLSNGILFEATGTKPLRLVKVSIPDVIARRSYSSSR